MPTEGVGLVEWREALASPVLCEGRVHLWRIDLDQFRPATESAWEVLSDDESARARRFRFERDCDRFVIRRAFLRSILGSYLDADPRRLEFHYGEARKPYLAEHGGSGDLRFNQSESAGLALFAFALGLEVGVDVEKTRDVKADDLAQRFFAPAEVQALRAMPEADRLPGFFRCWTRKEAYVKAHGAGLSMPLDSFEVSLAWGDQDALLSSRGEGGDAGRWTMRDVAIDPAYAAALCAEGRDWRPECWNMPAEWPAYRMLKGLVA